MFASKGTGELLLPNMIASTLTRVPKPTGKYGISLWNILHRKWLHTHTQAHTNATWYVYEPLIDQAYALWYLFCHP